MLAMKMMLSGFTVASVLAASAVTITPGSVTQDADSKLITVPYGLSGGAAVVTVRILVKGDDGWQALGEANCTTLCGDVARRLEPSDALKVCWQPRVDWPNRDIAAGDVRFEITAWPLDNPPDYMVVDLDLSLKNAVRYYASKEMVPGGVSNALYKTDRLLMRKIPACEVEWTMGRSPCDEVSMDVASYEPAHKVTLSENYYIGVYEFTQKQYWWLTGERPSPWSGADYPDYDMRPVSYIKFAWADSYKSSERMMSDLAKLTPRTGIGFTLPTEAQWEFACRAGHPDAYYSGSITGSGADAIAWHSGNSAVDGVQQPHVVGLKEPNDWGLYDMCGNVWEMCRDKFVSAYSDGSAVRDPLIVSATPDNGYTKRGGGCTSSKTQNCRCASRYNGLNNTGWWGGSSTIGFRACCPATAGCVE